MVRLTNTEWMAAGIFGLALILGYGSVKHEIKQEEEIIKSIMGGKYNISLTTKKDIKNKSSSRELNIIDYTRPHLISSLTLIDNDGNGTFDYKNENNIREGSILYRFVERPRLFPIIVQELEKKVKNAEQITTR